MRSDYKWPNVPHLVAGMSFGLLSSAKLCWLWQPPRTLSGCRWLKLNGGQINDCPGMGKSRIWNAADPAVASDVPIFAWPFSVKPRMHALTWLFVACSAHPETLGAHWQTEQCVTLICYPLWTIQYHSACSTGPQWSWQPWRPTAQCCTPVKQPSMADA